MQDIHLVCADKNISRLSKARDANVLSFTTESFEESPKLMLASTANWKDAKAVASSNEFQSKYAWGHSELIEYKNAKGERLQGALYYPAGFEAGHKYPMVVYMYEKLSDSLHRSSALSERTYYGPSAFTSHGYFLLLPDIRFRPREPGISVAECVTAAVKKALQNTAIDQGKSASSGTPGRLRFRLSRHPHPRLRRCRRRRTYYRPPQQLRESSLEFRHCGNRPH